ncbi:MAG: hypothetical protein WAN16_07105 [Chthoniobacterales bacterium]
MCATFEIQGRAFRPGREVLARAKEGLVRPVWAGFARSEILGWWERRGGELLDIPAERFAERSDQTRRLVWDDVPGGLVLRGVMERGEGSPLVRIVTRAATEAEVMRFQHPRMPLLERALYEPLNSGDFGDLRDSEDQGQGLLF